MTDERIIAYLLEELPEDDVQRFEEECFAEADGLAQVNCVEEDLIDAYLRNELTPERRQRFEQHYLTTASRQERVSMAAALLRLIDERNAVFQPAVVAPAAELPWTVRCRAFWQRQGWALRAVAAVAVITIIASFVWFAFFRAPAPRTFATLTLTISANNRADGAQAGKVKLPLEADALKISLLLPQQLSPPAHYRVAVENDRGESKSAEVVGVDSQSVLTVIPAAQLARGQYAVKLFAVNSEGTEQRINGSYFFTVE